MPFPVSLPGTLNITGSLVSVVGHGTIIHTSDRNDIIALGTKVGLGSSTPTGTVVLTGTGAGTSAWAQVSKSYVPANAFGIRRLAATTASVNGSALAASGTFTILSDQNFVVGDASSVVGISIGGYAQAFQASAGAVTSRMVLDSGGTPSTILLGGQRVQVAAESSNPFSGANTKYVTGLSAGTHTVQVQVLSDQVGTIYMRNGTSGETFGADIMEWMR